MTCSERPLGNHFWKKRRPKPYRGERILATLWSLQMPWITEFGGSHKKALRAFLGSFRSFSEFPLENPSRTFGANKKKLAGTRRFVFKVKVLEDLHSETGRIRFRRARLQTPNSVSFLALTEFRGESSVSSSQPIICVPERTHRVFSQNSPCLP